MIVFLLVCGVALGGCASLAQAQTAPYNPYATTQDLGIAKDPEGKPQWPPFYKPIELSPKHVFYYAMGFCQWKPSSYQLKPSDIVDVNKLPELTFTGVVASTNKILMLNDNDGATDAMVLFHPGAGVTQWRISGEASQKALRRGVTVRVAVDLDEEGEPRGPARMITIVPPEEEQERATGAGRSSPFVALVLGRDSKGLKLLQKTAKNPRFSVELDDRTRIDVNSDDASLLGPGDRVVAKGRVYRQADKPGRSVLFAENLEVTLDHGPFGKSAAPQRIAGK